MELVSAVSVEFYARGSVAWSRNLVDERMDVAYRECQESWGSIRCIKD